MRTAPPRHGRRAHRSSWDRLPFGVRGWLSAGLGGMLAVALLVLAGIPVAGPADAFWRSTGRGVGSAVSGTLNAPTGVTVAATSTSPVSVSWTASGGTTVPTGYFVTRTAGASTIAACGSSATALLTTTSCSDTGVAAGTYTYAVTAVFRSWTAVSASSGSVVVIAATKLGFTVQPTSAVAGVAITPSIAVALQNAAGTTVAAAGVAITLSIGTNPAAGTLSGTVTALTNSSGIATFAGLSLDKAAAGYTLSAASPGLTAATSGTFTITPAAASKLAFTSAPVTTTASATTNSTAITVQRQDAFGNAVTSGTASALTLTSNTAGTAVFAPTNLAAAATVSIAAGSSTATFFYGDTRVGTPTITAASTGLTSATQVETVAAAAASKLVFTSVAVTAVASATTNTSAITVQRQDAFNNPAPATAVTPLTLTSNSGGTAIFAPTSGAAGSTVSFATGSSTATFFHGDTRAGTPVITAALSGLTSATQTETITPASASKLAFTSATRSAPASATPNGTAITVQRQDAFGNAVTSATASPLTLTSNTSGTAVFGPTSGAAPATVSIAAGASTATFYYGDTKIGTPTITAAASGLTSASLSETVTAGAAATLVFTQQPGNIVSGTPFSPAIKVSAVDAFGNPVSTAISLSIANNPSLLGVGRLWQNGVSTNPVVVTSDASGVATFSGVSIAGALLSGLASGNGYTLQATVGSVSVVSTAFNVTAG
ncbi:hypothetical protein [Subtercola sp. Z020]|uniref:beta strand repeat-containing protein n=1 Tax=Subtercola sp. Z020 TaxID=2080582 RepID=UPI0011B090B6|nr:hypothetical protein [Subtercola sp. Z020]